VIDILVISNNRIIFDEINLAFSASTYNYEYADSWESAVDFLDSEVPDFIFLIDIELDKIAEMLEKLSGEEYQNNIPIICFTEIIPKEERFKLYEAGAFDVISLPVLKDELSMLVKKYSSSFHDDRNVMSAGMQGRIEDFSVIDLIQTLEEGKKSAILKMKRNGSSGQILFQDGQIYASEYGKFSSIDSILNLVGWIRGDFLIEFTEQEFEKEIELDNQQILLDAIQRIDARSGFLKQLPPIDDILLISPDTDMHKIDVDQSKFLKFFQGGNTIYQYLINFDLDELILLEKILHLYNGKMLLTREQFDAYTTEYEAEVEKGSIKGVFNRFLKKTDKSKNKTKQREAKKGDKNEIIYPGRENILMDSVILIDPVILKEFKEKIAEL
jgi:CheY-like chemotaxis protein